MISRQEFKLQDMMTWDKTKANPDVAATYSGRFEGLTVSGYTLSIPAPTGGANENVRPNNTVLQSS